MAEPFFKTLAQDLLNLEINTIIKPEMSAVKMPSSRRQALSEVARDYSLKLQEFNVRAPVQWEFAGTASFSELCERAKRGIKRFEEALKTAPPDEKYGIQRNIKMLERIQYQSLQIVHMFKMLEKGVKERAVERGPGYREAPPLKPVKELKELADKGTPMPAEEPHRESEMWNNDINRDRMVEIDDLDLTPDQVTLIRKAWEIGTEQIVLQTVIQLDGDVTTRISEGFAKNPNQTILKIHNDSIVVSTGFWASLVKTAGEIVGKAFGLVLGR